MEDSTSRFLSCAAALLIMAALAAACLGGLAGRAGAYADIRNYLQGPNLFYPAKHDLNGTAVKQVIDVLGWNSTAIDGNVGIGNGSARIFDDTSTFDVEYPAQAFMCADVSAQPWIPGLKTQPPPEEAEAAEAATGSTQGEPVAPEENITYEKTSGNINLFALQPALRNASGSGPNETYNLTAEGAINQSMQGALNATNVTNIIPAANNATPVSKEQLAAANENQIYDAYHPIQYLRPVRDLLYEHPLSTSGCAYCQLLGFQTTAGELINVGMKATGYGY